MPRTVYYVAASADGFIADEQDKLDWLFQFNDAEGVTAHYQAFYERIGALAMGARTYEFVQNELKDGWPYKGKPTWVFTHRTLPAIPEADLRFTTEPAEVVYRQLVEAAGDKDIWLIGGGDLVGQFARAGLLDELHLGVAPVILGAGRPLLSASITKPMTLTEVTRFGMGFVELRYALPRS